jgi:hypothetical protein
MICFTCLSLQQVVKSQGIIIHIDVIKQYIALVIPYHILKMLHFFQRIVMLVVRSPVQTKINKLRLASIL